MVKVSVLYPNQIDATFDMTYYMDRHIPMVKDRLAAALRSASVDLGLGGGQPGTPPAFLVMAHLHFDSVDAFQQAFAPHAAEIVGDIPNYTNLQPTIQISDVKL